MEAKKYNNYDNFENFIKIQQLVVSHPFEFNICKSVLQLDELFKFLNEHFKEFHIKDNFRVILEFIDRCIKTWINTKDYLEDDIGILIVNLLAEHSNREEDINIVVQIFYQIMNTITYSECYNVLISEQVLLELIAIMPLIISRTITSNCIACIQKYIKIFPENKECLQHLWSSLKNRLEINLKSGLIKDVEIDILLQLIDEFKSFRTNIHNDPILINTLKYLLKSDQKINRKCGNYLLRKIICNVLENINTADTTWKSSDNIQQIENSWMIYITILENLEEDQSHLVLPSLENLHEMIMGKHLAQFWLDILYLKILTHNNNLVLRWSIVFFLKTFTCSDLSPEVLKALLQATNSNSLFNYEGYFIKREYIFSFLKSDVNILLMVISGIENWKSVPLYIWLESINASDLPKSLTFEGILKISSCVRKLQNCIIRKKAIIVCEELFQGLITKMSMKEYVTYIETLYNCGDEYNGYEMFFSKKDSLIQSKPEGMLFKQRFFEIFTNTKWDNHRLLLFLNDIPLEHHGWLKYVPFKQKLNSSDRNYINHLYKLNLNLLGCSNIYEVKEIFQEKLLGPLPYDKHDLTECNQSAISFYIYESDNIKIENEKELYYILNAGLNYSQVLETLVERILNHTSKKIDMWLIDQLLSYNNEIALRCVLNYLHRVYELNVLEKYEMIIIKNSNYAKFIPDKLVTLNSGRALIDLWLKKIASQGDKRIEEAYVFNDFKYFTPSPNFLTAIKLQPENDFQLDLLKYHMAITKKKPRYFENSNEHRVKLRIAYCLYHSVANEIPLEDTILDQIWYIVLSENNQLNINYIYEYLLGKKERRENVILCKLKESLNLTSSQQVSIILVAYMYFQTRPSTDAVRKEMVYALLSLTMGAHFQTRLFAQMCLHQLLKYKFNKKEEWSSIIDSIEAAAGTKISEYLDDIRLHIIDLSKDIDPLEIILYVTNAPFDEIRNIISLESKQFSDQWKQIESCREKYLKKFKLLNNDESTPKSITNDTIQRKMNPANNLSQPHNLVAFPIEKKYAEMIVVASLIDKLPNLGGIARTCEVLGIENLVIDSKMHVEKNDFKNLSMTAERTLNIIEVKPKDLKEFLITKSLEGYNIIGAEQTCKSENFSNFQFPQKCVLLLGHEKDGIPASLLGLLDTAVEIPQFGQVRSLNVHVTAALFMWEFCKQHLILDAKNIL